MKAARFLASILVASLATAKPLDLLKRWTIDAPDDWWYAETATSALLKVSSVGVESPEPVKGAPFFLVPREGVKAGSIVRGASAPKIIRGISLGVADVPVAIILPPGSKLEDKVEKPLAGDLATKAHRRELEVTGGKLILYAWSLSVPKLPGATAADSEGKTAVLHIAGQTEEEVDRFIKVFATLRSAQNEATQASAP